MQPSHVAENCHDAKIASGDGGYRDRGPSTQNTSLYRRGSSATKCEDQILHTMSIMEKEQQTAPTSVFQEDQPRGSMDPNTMATTDLNLLMLR